MKLVIGLGNPGDKYQNTWHNLGWLALDKIRQDNDFPAFKNNKKLRAEISEKKIGCDKIILAKPQTFMNNSGEAAVALVKYYKIKTEDIIIIHDDVDLPLGKIRIAIASASGGHNGVQSIIDHLNTKDFIRIKIGCRAARTEIIGTLDYVLKPIDQAGKPAVALAIQKAGEAATEIISASPETAMNKFN
jgi:PTH1 family peptidyl-tRNA hydrolase